MSKKMDKNEFIEMTDKRECIEVGNTSMTLSENEHKKDKDDKTTDTSENKEKDTPEKKSCFDEPGSRCWSIRWFFLLIWDGLGFFGFDDTKLARLKGVPLDFKSKFSSTRWVLLTFLMSVVLILVLVLESGTYGTQKSKTISLI